MQQEQETRGATTVHAPQSGEHNPAQVTSDGLGRDDMVGLLQALLAVRDGDFSVRMPHDKEGLAGRIADTFNDIVSTNQQIAKQLEHVGQVVGKEGKTRQRLRIGLQTGSWGDMENSVNSLIDDLLWPTTEVTRSIEAVAQGDLLVRPCASTSTAAR